MGEPKPVSRVVQVSAYLTKSDPPHLNMHATGEVTSGGWTNAQLGRRMYPTPPQDGIQEYDFVATPPDGPSTQALEEVDAKEYWEEVPDWLRGVRVYGEQNEIEKIVRDSEKE